MNASPSGKAVYAGTFDPITRGHEWVIKTMAPLFDVFVVAVGSNPEKSPLFDVPERVQMIEGRIKKFGLANVFVDAYPHQLLVTYARSIDAGYIVRGIRSHSDFDYEFATRHVNAGIDPGITTLWVSPPLELAMTSSSLVKEFFRYPDGEANARKYVSASIMGRMKRKFEELRHG
ncbi:MAG TPA: pantetheine-phosphate adenylyltransferase [Candidatus Paceibacterota bacterium]|nr:pantetheine-phosphate adenylyltransferase [Candidatus Paceibacterota bacterium]